MLTSGGKKIPYVQCHQVKNPAILTGPGITRSSESKSLPSCGKDPYHRYRLVRAEMGKENCSEMVRGQARRRTLSFVKM